MGVKLYLSVMQLENLRYGAAKNKLCMLALRIQSARKSFFVHCICKADVCINNHYTSSGALEEKKIQRLINKYI